MQDVSTHEFGTEKISKLMMKFALPAIISMVVNSLYNIVDQIFIGWGVGYVGNAATNVVFPFIVLSMGVSFMIGDGAASYFSLKLGEGKMDEVQSSLGNAILFSATAGTIFMIVGLVFLQPILKLFGATESVMPYAIEYGRIVILGMPFFCVGIATAAMIRADGSPGYNMVAMLVGAIANTILDPLFIFVFGWGVQGAALATIIGQILTFTLNILYLRKFKTFKFTRKTIKLNWHTIRKIVVLGISSFIGQLAITVMVTVMNNALVTHGGASIYGADIPLAALGIVMKVNQILVSVVIGLAIGGQPIVGFNYGAGKFDRVRQTYWQMVMIGASVTLVGFLMFQFAPQAIVNLFGTGNELYNEFAIKSFRIFLALCIFSSFNDVSSIYFQSIGKPIQSAVLSLSRQLVFLVPAILILSNLKGVEGLLFAGPIADGLAFILSTILITKEMANLKEKENKLKIS